MRRADRTGGRDGRLTCHQRMDYVGDVTGSAAHPVDAAGLVLPEPSWPDRPGSPARSSRCAASATPPTGRTAPTRGAPRASWRTGWPARGTGRSAGSTPRRELGWSRCATPSGRACARATSGPSSRWPDRSPCASSLRRGAIAVAPAGTGVDAVVEQAGAGRGGCDGGRHARAPQVVRPLPVGVLRHVEEPPRRWCSMPACGGREKAKAYRRRRDATAPRPGPTGGADGAPPIAATAAAGRRAADRRLPRRGPGAARHGRAPP